MFIKKGYKNAITDDKDWNFKKSLIIIKLLCKDGLLIYIKDCFTVKEAWDKLEFLYNLKGFISDYLLI